VGIFGLLVDNLKRGGFEGKTVDAYKKQEIGWKKNVPPGTLLNSTGTDNPNLMSFNRQPPSGTAHK